MQEPTLLEAFYRQAALGHVPMVVIDAYGEPELIGFIPNDPLSISLVHNPSDVHRIAFLCKLAKFAYDEQAADVPD